MSNGKGERQFLDAELEEQLREFTREFVKYAQEKITAPPPKSENGFFRWLATVLSNLAKNPVAVLASIVIPATGLIMTWLLQQHQKEIERLQSLESFISHVASDNEKSLGDRRFIAMLILASRGYDDLVLQSASRFPHEAIDASLALVDTHGKLAEELLQQAIEIVARNWEARNDTVNLQIGKLLEDLQKLRASESQIARMEALPDGMLVNNITNTTIAALLRKKTSQAKSFIDRVESFTGWTTQGHRELFASNREAIDQVVTLIDRLELKEAYRRGATLIDDAERPMSIAQREWKQIYESFRDFCDLVKSPTTALETLELKFQDVAKATSVRNSTDSNEILAVAESLLMARRTLNKY